MNTNPLAEVFGFPTDNFSNNAERYRKNRLCPFHNKVPSCTKNSATNPLGVCSIFYKNSPVITCPIRFTENWLFAEEAARFFFDEQILSNGRWTTLREVRLEDEGGKTAGNIDYVLVSYSAKGDVIDFGALEIQAVYISGNVTKPFDYYMSTRQVNKSVDWSNLKQFPRPDYLSSSRKRLAPQLIYKGGILSSWGKRQAVVMQKCFYDTIPDLPRKASPEQADMVWFIVNLNLNEQSNVFELVLTDTIYTEFKPALNEIIMPKPGKFEDFVSELQNKLDKTLDDLPPEAPTLTDIISR